MDKVTVFLVEPDPARRIHFERCLSFDETLILISRHDSSFADNAFTAESPYEVLLLDADRTPVTDPRIWARIHLLLPDVHIIALTDGTNAQTLQAVLAAGINGLFRPDCDPAILNLAIHKAARGLIDFDPPLVKLARTLLLEPLTETQIRFGGLTLDLESHEVARWGQHIHLTPLEFSVVAYLARQRSRTVCLTELLSAVWLAPPDHGGTLAQVHNCIKRIRQKIEPDVRHPRYLRSARGWGYWLQDPTLLHTDAPHEHNLIDLPLSEAFPRTTDR